MFDRPGLFLAKRRMAIETAIGKVHGDCDERTCRWLNVSYADAFGRFEPSRVAAGYGDLGTRGTEFGLACVQVSEWYSFASGGIQAVADIGANY